MRVVATHELSPPPKKKRDIIIIIIESPGLPERALYNVLTQGPGWLLVALNQMIGVSLQRMKIKLW